MATTTKKSTTSATVATLDVEIAKVTGTATPSVEVEPPSRRMSQPPPEFIELQGRVAKLEGLVSSLLETALVADRRIQRLGGGQF